jgi:uncharacterized membrane protein YeaQ/YmgE (transglycosylase-associated protein family)
MLINIIVWIILGAIAGWLASIIVGRNDDQGAFGNIIVGIIGAIIGGALVRILGIGSGVSGLNLWSIIIATVGAILLLLVIGAFRSRGSRL